MNYTHYAKNIQKLKLTFIFACPLEEIAACPLAIRSPKKCFAAIRPHF